MPADRDAVIARLQARVAELEAALAKARYDATHDPLTGLLNRGGFSDAWEQEARADRSVALFDLDGFKQVNDRYGHAAGDAVLAAVADQIRGLPVAARLGGDEFAALAGPDDLLPTGVVVALPGGPVVRVGVSVGLAPAVGDLSAALGCADAALYRAKVTGGVAVVYDRRRDDRPVVQRPQVRLRDDRPVCVGDVLGVTTTGGREDARPLAETEETCAEGCG